MFKSAISSLTSAVIGATKETVKQYLPHVENEGDSVRKLAINTVIQGGIARIAFRSPILSDIAQNTFKVHQLETAKRQKVSEYVKSSRADWLRPVVKDSLDPKASDKKINEEMTLIISKISKEIDRVGVEDTKKSGQFKEYEKYFEEYMTKNKETPVGAASIASTPHSLEDEILNRIESNTRQTVNTLESLSIGGVGGSSPTKSNPSFIDPLTGMPSINAGIGAIGGSFLSKFFDDDLIEKFAKKAKTFFFEDEEQTQQVRPQSSKPQSTRKNKKRGMDNLVSTMFEKDLFDLDTNSRKNYVPNIDANVQDNTTEASKEINKERVDIANKQQSTSEEILQELKHLNKTTEKQVDKKDEKQVDGKSGVAAKIVDKGKETLLKRFGGKYLSKIIPRGASKLTERVLSGQGDRVMGKLAGRVVPAAEKILGSGSVVKSLAGRVATTTATGSSIIPAIARFAAPLLAPVLVGAAIVGGVALTGGAIATGISKLMGKGGDKSLDKMSFNDRVEAVTQRKPQKTISGSDQMSPATTNKVVANNSSKISELNKINNAKIQKDTENKNQTTIINNNNGSKGGLGVSSQTTIAASSIRNRESTFERVQMQDFWPRVA